MIFFAKKTKHDEHNPGEWIWEYSNTTVEWFDWAPGEPNDYHRQQCMTFLRYDYGNVSLRILSFDNYDILVFI